MYSENIYIYTHTGIIPLVKKKKFNLSHSFPPLSSKDRVKRKYNLAIIQYSFSDVDII